MSAPVLRVQVEAALSTFALEVELELGLETLALAGPSGAGKSTLLKLLLGALTPRRGRIDLGGATLFDAAGRVDIAPERRGLGYVPQDYALFPHLSARDNVAFALACAASPRPRDAHRSHALELLDQLGVAHVADQLPARLSGGERQRVALARALATRPRALLLDEPLAALDTSTRRAVRLALGRHLSALGLPVLCVSHDARDAAALADRIAVMEAGRIVQVGSFEELRARPATEFVKEFVAEPG